MTSIDTSQNIDNYRELYKAFGELHGIIKKRGVSNFEVSGVYKDIYNSKKIFENALTYLLPTFEGTLTNGGYTNTDKLTIPTANRDELKITQPTTFDTGFFKNILRNCFNLDIDQSIYISLSTGVTNAGINKLTADGTTKTKQHLHFYNKILTESGKGGTRLQFDQAIVKNIYYTIFLLDVYIKIIESFLTIDFNLNPQKNEAFWDNTPTEVKTESDYISNNPEQSELVHFANLDTSNDNKKYIKDYNTIHIVSKPLVSGDALNTPKGLFIIEPTSDQYKYTGSGVYLYIANDFQHHSPSLQYFNTKEMHAASSQRPSTRPANITTANSLSYTFVDRYGQLQDGISLISGTDKYGYGYHQYDFSNVAGGNFTDAKKPYQKFIRIFLIMLRNIKYVHLNSTLDYLNILFKSLKKLLLSSINAINIYHNLAYSLNNCLLLNYPNYKASDDTTTSSNKFISYITDAATLTLPAEIVVSNFDDNYKKTFIYNVTKTSGNFKNILDKNIELLENHMDRIDISPNTNSRYSYVADTDLLIYASFIYDSANNSINPYDNTPAVQKSKNKLIQETLDTKIRYSILIPDYNILLSIEDVTTTNNGNPIILLKEFENKLYVNKPQEAQSTTRYLHSNVKVYLYENSIFELEKTNLTLKSKIENIDKNINSNKTKILNNASLFEASKSKNTILYYEYVIYITIVSLLIATIFIINIARVDRALMKIISLICFGITILMLAVYYIINVLYVNESYIETFTTTTLKNVYSTAICTQSCMDPTETISGINKPESDPDISATKRSIIISRLTDKARELINSINIANYYTDTQTLFNKEIDLNSLISNKYNDKNYVNYFLENKTGDAHLNTDIIKYENANYDIYIFTIILLSIIIIGSYTINLYTNNIYMGIFFLIAIILIISLFTYFIININRIVRTVSSNYYWGREFNKTYENFEDYEESQSSNKMLNINSDLQTEQNTQSVQNTEGQSTENILDNIKKQSLQKGSSGTNPEEPSEFIKSSIKVMTNS
jgi:hypothetical protein